MNWISITKRLPDDGQMVHTKGAYSAPWRPPTEAFFGPTRFLGSRFEIESVSIPGVVRTVTHWAEIES